MARASSPVTAWLRGQTRLGQRAAWPAIAASLLGTTLAALQAVLVGRILAGLVAGAAPSWLLAAFAMLAVARAGLVVAGERAAAEAGARARRRLRSAALAALLAAGPGLLRQRHSAELAAIVVDRIELLDGFFARYIPAAVLALAAPAVVLLAALLLAPFAALVLLLAGLLVPFGMALSGIGAAAASRRQLVALERLQVRFIDRVRGIATLVLAGRADDEVVALARAADELRRRTLRVLRVAFLSSTILDLAAAGAIIALALHFAPRMHTAAASGLAAVLLVPEFFAPLRAFAAAYQDRGHAAAAAQALVALPDPPAPQALPAVVRTVQAHGIAVAFEGVTVQPDPERPPALEEVSFRLAAGETLILAGPSGAGKSTVLEVLVGFVRPTAGRVTLNGADIASVVPQALAGLVGWVGQQPMLFAASLEENVRFARPDASEAEVAEAVRAARLDRVLAALPEGMATRLGEGGYGLSGGQAQRVAIARAYLKNAPVLLLDEPTAHLDPATEGEVLDSLRRLAIGRTVLLASHSAAVHVFPGRRLDLRAGRVVQAEAAAMRRGAA